MAPRNGAASDRAGAYPPGSSSPRRRGSRHAIVADGAGRSARLDSRLRGNDARWSGWNLPHSPRHPGLVPGSTPRRGGSLEARTLPQRPSGPRTKSGVTKSAGSHPCCAARVGSKAAPCHQNCRSSHCNKTTIRSHALPHRPTRHAIVSGRQHAICRCTAMASSLSVVQAPKRWGPNVSVQVPILSMFAARASNCVSS